MPNIVSICISSHALNKVFKRFKFAVAVVVFFFRRRLVSLFEV